MKKAIYSPSGDRREVHAVDLPGYLNLKWTFDPPAPKQQKSAKQAAKGKTEAEVVTTQALNVNIAKQEDIEKLPSITSAMATAIVALRDANNGKFTSLDQLDEIPGISNEHKKLLSLK